MTCGTRAAYQRHLRAGQPPCDACLVAKSVYERTRNARLNLEALLAPDVPSKEDCPTCRALVDDHGRWPVPNCGPWCAWTKARAKMRSIG